MDTPHDLRTTATRGVFLVKLLAALAVAIGVGTSAPARGQTAAHAVVAVVDGRSITAEELDNSIVAQLLPLEQQIYALRKAALENLITRAVLEGEAKRRAVSVEELRKQLTAGSVSVPQSEVEEVYSEHAATFASMSPDEARERLRLDLETQARMKNYRDGLARLRQSAAVELRLEEPRLPALAAADTAPSLGRLKAPVTITEFADFQCPYCRAAHATLKQIVRDYADDVRLVFKHLPLDGHAEALPAARAAYCAGRQGSFWPYHDALFAAENFSAETFKQIAAGLKLNPSEFDACFNSDATRAAILEDVREAQHLGISGTPTFIINGRLVRGALSPTDFKAVIESELQSARAASQRP